MAGPRHARRSVVQCLLQVLPLIVSCTTFLSATDIHAGPPGIDIRFAEDGLPAVLAPAGMVVHRTVDAPPVTERILLTNTGSKGLKIHFAEDLPWLVIEPKALSLDSGRMGRVRMILSSCRS